MDITHIIVYVLGILFSILLLTLFISYLIFKARQSTNNNHLANESNIPGTRTILRASPANIYPVPGIEKNISSKAAYHNSNIRYIAGFNNGNGNGNGNGHFKGNGHVRYSVVNYRVPYDQTNSEYFVPDELRISKNNGGDQD